MSLNQFAQVHAVHNIIHHAAMYLAKYQIIHVTASPPSHKSINKRAKHNKGRITWKSKSNIYLSPSDRCLLQPVSCCWNKSSRRLPISIIYLLKNSCYRSTGLFVVGKNLEGEKTICKYTHNTIQPYRVLVFSFLAVF